MNLLKEGQTVRNVLKFIYEESNIKEESMVLFADSLMIDMGDISINIDMFDDVIILRTYIFDNDINIIFKMKELIEDEVTLINRLEKLLGL